MVEPELPLDGGSHSEAVRVGGTVRRVGRPWSGDVLDLLRHLENAGVRGVPRALGFDEHGREILSFVDGEPGSPDAVRSDEALRRVGRLLRECHDAAASFDHAGRVWQVPVQQPVETVCHNDVQPGNVVFRDGLPVALIDWEAAAPGPRAWDLGYAAWFWVPFRSDEHCRAAGMPTGIAEKRRRFRVLLDAYGIEPEIELLRTGIARMRQYHDYLWSRVADGSAWEIARAERGELDELAREIAWVEDNADALV